MKTQYKILVVAPLCALTMNACKATFYANTFVTTHNNKVLLKDASTEEERLIDCSKGSDTKQLLSDLPYFKEGDPVNVQTVQRYNGFRVFKIDETVLDYNHDTIQIRKDKEVIEAFKRDTVQRTK